MKTIPCRHAAIKQQQKGGSQERIDNEEIESRDRERERETERENTDKQRAGESESASESEERERGSVGGCSLAKNEDKSVAMAVGWCSLSLSLAALPTELISLRKSEREVNPLTGCQLHSRPRISPSTLPQQLC